MSLPSVFNFIRPGYPTLIHKVFTDEENGTIRIEWAEGWKGDPTSPLSKHFAGMWNSCSISDAQWWIDIGSWIILDPDSVIIVENTETGSIYQLTKVDGGYTVDSLSKKFTIGMYDSNLVKEFIDSGIWKIIEGV